MSGQQGSTASAAVPGAVRDPYQDSKSIEFGFRAKRFIHVQRLIETIVEEKGFADILDLGGTETYWKIGADALRRLRGKVRITLVNPEQETVRDNGIFSFVSGSGTDPQLFRDRPFDLVHSNSVIEHVGSYGEMQAFAANVRRLAPRYYVQTPNYWFAYEPHFRFVGFQYLPETVRARIIMTKAQGFFQRIETYEEAMDIIRHHSLLSTRQMRTLFPDAVVSHEILLGLRKSIIAIKT